MTGTQEKMMDAKHTPGPWHIDQQSETGGVFIKPVPGQIVAEIDTHNEQANAALIAAAPDMLDALEAMVTSYRGPRENLDAARAAIAKAKGGAS